MSLNDLWQKLVERTDYERCERPRAARPSNQSAVELLERLGCPQDRVPAIHVAGSKGKGSVCQYLARGLAAAGQRVGVYSSPHLSSWRERIEVDGHTVADDELSSAMRAVLAASDGSETFFDLFTAVAFLVFSASGCTVQVVEVGLGGRFDSTRVLRPLASLITFIELEHAEILGPGIAQIAWNKAGIFHERAQAWVGAEFADECWPVFEAEAASVGQQLQIAPSSAPCTHEIEPQVMARNYALAHAVLRALDVHFPGAADALTQLDRHALQLKGRFERRLGAAGQTVIFDVAHSENSLAAVLELFRRRYHDKQRGVLFALRDDKDAAQLAAALKARIGETPADEAWWVCPAGDHPRSAAPNDLAGVFGAQPLAVPQLPVGPEVLLVTGSTYLVGALRPSTQPHRSHD